MFNEHVLCCSCGSVVLWYFYRKAHCKLPGPEKRLAMYGTQVGGSAVNSSTNLLCDPEEVVFLPISASSQCLTILNVFP